MRSQQLLPDKRSAGLIPSNGGMSAIVKKAHILSRTVTSTLSHLQTIGGAHILVFGLP